MTQKKAKVLLLSGPNLGLLGTRQPDIYGLDTLDDYVEKARQVGLENNIEIVDFQSNHEGDLVDIIGKANQSYEAIIINPGALTHYGWSLHDALVAFEGIVIELHISNPNAREPWRHTSVVSPVAKGTIAGFGKIGYELAVLAVAKMIDQTNKNGD